MKYQIQVHFENKSQFNFEYEPEVDEHINDFLLRFDEPKEKYLLTGDETSHALVNTDFVAAVLAFPLPKAEIIPYKG